METSENSKVSYYLVQVAVNPQTRPTMVICTSDETLMSTIKSYDDVPCSVITITLVEAI